MMTQAEEKATTNRWGIMVPNKDTMLVANSYFPKVCYRMAEIIQILVSSGLIMIPSEKDFQGNLGLHLEKYFKLNDMGAQDVVALQRLAWELSAGSFAGRQIQTVKSLEGPFDCVFLDATKSEYPFYHSMLWDKLSVGGIILADNMISHQELIGIEAYKGLTHLLDEAVSVTVPIGNGVEFTCKIK